jgi:predicted nucleic acid-binding protein
MVVDTINMIDPTKPHYILDTSQLSILCRFPLNGQPYIQTIISVIRPVIPEAVILEARRGTSTIAQVASPLVNRGLIHTMIAPTEPRLLDEAYAGELGAGERAVIRLALSTQLPCILDDKDAFIVACRFGLRPLIFQDFIIDLVHKHGLPVTTGIEIIQSTARWFPIMFLEHSLRKLQEDRGSS